MSAQIEALGAHAPGSPDEGKAQRLGELLALVDQRHAGGERERLATFCRAYFRQVDPDDICQRSAEDLYGIASSHLQFLLERPPGQPKLRVLNPSTQHTGFGSRHTIVEVVNDDMPFLVDSTSMEVNRQGLTLHLIIHPIFAVRRDAQGRLLALAPREEQPDWPRESVMHLEVDRLSDPVARAGLAEGIERVLGDVRAAVEDWKPMVAQLRAVIREVDERPPPVPREELVESRAFLQWLTEDHMLLLGYRSNDLRERDGELELVRIEGSGLGILRDSGARGVSISFSSAPREVRNLAAAPSPMMLVTKATTRATVHRPGYVDYVGVKRYDAAGKVVGEHRFVGLFTSAAYATRVSEVPLVRGKVRAVIERAGLAPASHLGKALVHILESYPRDELFQISTDELAEIATGILQLGERQRFRLFIRRDAFERFVSCLIFVPRENYTTELRRRFQWILLEAFNGSAAEFDVLLTDAALARIHITVRTTPGRIPACDRRALERQLAATARRWEDDLRDALDEGLEESRAAQLLRRFGGAFPASYREHVDPVSAVEDLHRLERLARAELVLHFYRRRGTQPGRVGFKIYRSSAPVPLSDSLPMLERMGVRVLAERPYEITPDGGEPMWIHDFELELPGADELDIEALAPLFEDAFARVFDGRVENDDFNRLVLRAGLAAEEIVVLRAYAKYLRQTGFALSQPYIEATLAAHPRLAGMLMRLFRLRFSPQERDDAAAASQVRAIEQALDKVPNASEDRVLRQLLALMQATLRTNFWRTGSGASGEDGPRRAFVSFKFDPRRIPALPEPRPMFEIFVYSPRFEGVHLRGGKVARGGLRWSDRPEDFRTEVLGLVKAQMVKNTVIVPVGSKGGFVLKKAPPATDRDAFMKEGIACYQDYLRGLLDLTDNLVNGQVVPPPRVERHDGDDPYLVVAADKGTATFSDYANAISAEYGHWLGDAFASGGSAGYDHKGMGITARGAWESVKRHFREMGIDTQTTDFTCVGVGDMSGDVFGNGMLLSRHIRLVAAFDHRHIFVDPSPDAATGFAERERLFALPRTSWADYDAQKISAGGGIWSRAEKSIPVSPQAREALGIDAAQLTPVELITAILKAPVDLLYNGGIGTYVKSSEENHADVGDRANDAVRVNGSDLRCKVVGEGGNLGFTQRGRIEAALAGVRLYTDAIDNSAGVDTSDHEVNIKILLSMPVAAGRLALDERNALLAAMTDEVGQLVLEDNYFQTQALSVGHHTARKLLEQQQRFMRFLEKEGRLNRAIEFLPDDQTIAERRAAGLALTAPERAVLLAYSKMWLADELLASDLPEDPWVGRALVDYFPQRLRTEYAAEIERHPLRREIIATVVLNGMVNRTGPSFPYQLTSGTGSAPAQVVRAYLLTREVFALGPTWQAIEALDNVVADAVQAEMLMELGRRTVRATTWFLRSRRLAEPIGPTIDRFAPAVRALLQVLQQAPAGASWRVPIAEMQEGFERKGVPAPLAFEVAAAGTTLAALDLAEVAEAAQQPLASVAAAYFAIGETLGLGRVRTQVAALPSEGYWQALAKAATSDDLASLQRQLTADALAAGGLEAWQQAQAGALDRARRLLGELAESKSADLAMLSVALRELRNLA
jgi:glutamate dehydrogenase